MINNVIIKNPLIEELIANANYGGAAEQLLEDQKKTWQQLHEGYESLNGVKTKTFQYGGFKMKVQFNPGEYISTSAMVDVKSINSRKCFLCAANLPEEQKGILYEQDYLILGNPYPIFPEHLTIPNINHVPQQINDNFPLMLKMTKDLSKYYVVLYNGPKCGASAPDHFHFQAGTKNILPIGDDFHQLKNEYSEILFENDEVIVSAFDDGLRRMVSFECTDAEKMITAFNNFYNVYLSFSGNNEEPMMNIISSYEEDIGWRVIVFLREKHRSSHYFAEEENKILL